MKEYFAPVFTGREEPKMVLPHICLAAEKEHQKEQPKAVVCFGATQFYLLTTEELPQEYLVVGYLEVNKRAKKKHRLSSDTSAAVDMDGELYPVTEKRRGEITGYLQAEEEKGYLAVTLEKGFCPWFLLLPFVLLAVLHLWVYFFWTPTVPPLSVSDPVVEGELTPSVAANLDPAYFNIKVNATPIIKDGKMNLRVENSVRNLYDCYVEVTMEQEGEAKTIYRSVLIQPDQTLEYATVEADCVPGVYEGSALFQFYDNESVLLGNATVKLIINIM